MDLGLPGGKTERPVLACVGASDSGVSFECQDFPARVLSAGDLMILPANARCRAYQWLREEPGASTFLVVYAKDKAPPEMGRVSDRCVSGMDVTGQP